METYDYKKLPREKKEEEKFSDRVVKEGSSYRRLKNKEVWKAKKEEPKEEKVEFELPDMDWFFEGVLKLIPLMLFVGVTFYLLNSGVLNDMLPGVTKGFGMFMDDISAGNVTPIIFVVTTIIFANMMFGSRRRRWFL